jgi:hypothetical protein
LPLLTKLTRKQLSPVTARIRPFMKPPPVEVCIAIPSSM